MELDWSTFSLEILNFLILVWILKRFLYQPVLDVIGKRRAAIATTAAETAAARAQADELKQQFESRIAEWQREKQHEREVLQAELDAVRQQRLSDIDAELQAVRERDRAVEQRRAAATLEAQERTALTLAARFGARLLRRVASPAVEAALVRAVIEDLAALPVAKRQTLAEALKSSRAVRVLSAYPLGEAQAAEARRVLSELAGQGIPCQFEQDPELIAGIRIVAGPCTLHASLRDDLESFASMARDGQPA